MLRTMLFKSLRKLWNILIWRIIPQTAYLVSLVWRRSPMQAAFAWPDTMPTVGPRVALFVHFDSGQRVRPYVLHYLAQLVAADLSVLFVSNAGELLPEAIEQLKPFCAGILVRRNIGYDFVAMREGLVHFGLPRADTELLILANFLAAGPTLLRHPAWAKFWAQVAPVPSKRWVIAKYEVGITQWMLREGLRCAALWPYQQLLQEIDLDMVLQGVAANTPDTDPVIAMRRIQARRVRIGYVNRTAQNPTSDLWRQLLQAGFPFLKRELLRDNPTAVSDIVDWRMVVQETSSADISTIERDLQRQVRNQAP
jgi:hypothetical protein